MAETVQVSQQDGHFNESIVNEEILEDMKKNRIDHMKYLPDMEQLEESDVMDQVISAMNAYDYDKYTEADVRRALAHDNRTPEDFQALLSPAALPLLEEIAQAARIETRKHFGNSVCMFTPIYIANYCENYCIYCGFNCHNKIRRAQLNEEEIEKEMAAIVGVSPPTFHDWLKGKKMPRMNNVQKLADYFGVKLSDLIEEKVTPTIEKNSDIMVDITVRLGADISFRNVVKRNFYDKDFFALSEMLCDLDSEQLVSVKQMLSTFFK